MRIATNRGEGALVAMERATRRDHFNAYDLCVEYAGKAGRVAALSSVNLSAAKGEFVAIVGPSGCGKSTLLKVACDLVPATRGSIRIGGRTAQEARREHRVGVVFQTPTLLPWRSVLANVRLGRELVGWSRAGRSPKEMVELVGLSEFARATPAELSGGMRQRVAIARALVLEPEILLMDEPFGALDEFTRAELGLELLRIWNASQCTILFVTHSVEEAVTLADRIVVMSARPGVVLGEIGVSIGRPRGSDILESEDAFEITREVRRLLRQGRMTDQQVPHPATQSESRG